MAVRTTEEIMNILRNHIGDDTSDASLSLLEDVQDTFSDMETRANGDGINWQQRYEDNDREWREKYRNRFFSADPIPDPEPEAEPAKRVTTFEELFKED